MAAQVCVCSSRVGVCGEPASLLFLMYENLCTLRGGGRRKKGTQPRISTSSSVSLSFSTLAFYLLHFLLCLLDGSPPLQPRLNPSSFPLLFSFLPFPFPLSSPGSAESNDLDTPSEKGVDQWDRRKCHSRKPPRFQFSRGFKTRERWHAITAPRLSEWICLFEMVSLTSLGSRRVVFADSNKVARDTLDLERSNWKGVNLLHQGRKKERKSRFENRAIRTKRRF